jgi:hypothetical protein
VVTMIFIDAQGSRSDATPAVARDHYFRIVLA